MKQKKYNEITLDEEGNIKADNLPMRSKCFLYFDKKDEDLGKKTFEMLAQLNPSLISKGEINHIFDGPSCSDTSCKYQDNGIYEAPDDDGTSYYFRGNVDNNWVQLGKTTAYDNYMWWRIIRINGDGSIRMIYAGSSSYQGCSPCGSGISKTSYSVSGASNDNKYVGFEYQDNVRNGNSKGANGEKSNALTTLNNWFKENLLDEYNAGYIDENAGFCNDRSTYSSASANSKDDNLGTGTKATYYGGYIRTVVTHKPSLQCPDIKNDLFTSKNSNQGTQSLEYPVGLITIDELVYTGNYYGVKGGGFLSKNLWTLTPSDFTESTPYLFSNDYECEGIKKLSSNKERYIVPVINLKYNVLQYGTGIERDPFRIDVDFGETSGGGVDFTCTVCPSDQSGCEVEIL